VAGHHQRRQGRRVLGRRLSVGQDDEERHQPQTHSTNRGQRDSRSAAPSATIGAITIATFSPENVEELGVYAS
jgi:hypothetical protein